MAGNLIYAIIIHNSQLLTFNTIQWCRGRDLNPHGISPTTPSRWRVYLFHHLGKVRKIYRFFIYCQETMSSKFFIQSFPSFLNIFIYSVNLFICYVLKSSLQRQIFSNIRKFRFFRKLIFTVFNFI